MGTLPLTGEALRINEIHYSTTFKSNATSLSSVIIEVYNNADTSVILSDYALQLNLITQPLPAIPLLPRRHFLVTMKNIDLRLGQRLQLVDLSNNISIDSLIAIGLSAEESYARVPDGSGSWSIQKRPSLGKENKPDYALENYSADWIPYGVQAPFGYRDGAGAIVFKGEMWLLGGWAHGPTVSDVWKSKNGVDWEYVTTAPWHGRHQFGALVFKEKMWVVGGDLLPDVWSSEDGVTWNLETDNAPWGDRYAPYVCAFDDKLWLMGGQKWDKTPLGTWDYNHPIGFNDVWYSSDGVNWTEATPSAQWKPRSMINGSAVFQGKMWILGGGIKQDTVTTSEYNDVWNSVDGVNWELVTDNAEWSPRIHLSTIVYNDKIWVTDGSPGKPTTLTNEVWSSPDGITWSEVKSDSRWSARHATSLFNYDGSLWVVAGFNANNAWRYSEPPTRYFSGATGLLSDLSTWSTEINGTGSHPQSFDRDNQVFVVANRDSVVLSDNLRIKGINSKLIVGTETDSVTLSLEETSTLDANVEVYSTASLVIRSASTPTLGKLHAGSTVTYTSGSNASLPSTAYYNVSISDANSYAIQGQLTVYGALNLGHASLHTDNGGIVDAHGDLTFERHEALSTARLRFSGSGVQRLTYTDSAAFLDASIDKIDGSLELGHGPTTFDRMALRGGSLIINEPITIRSPITWDQHSFISTTEAATVTVASSEAGEYILPVSLGSVRCPLLYSTKSASTLTVGLAQTENILAAGNTSLPQSLKYGWYISADVPMALTLLWDIESQDVDFSAENIIVNVLQTGADTTVSISSPPASIAYDLFPEKSFYFSTVNLAQSTTGFFVISDSRKAPAIRFALPTEIRYGDRIPFEVTNDAGLPMLYSVDGSVELIGDSLFAKTTGPFTLSVSTQAVGTFLAGAAVYNSEVSRAQAILAFDKIPKQQLSQQLYRIIATSSSSAPITFRSEDENIATVRGDTLFFNGPGTTSITAFQEGTDLFESTFATEIIEIELESVLTSEVVAIEEDHAREAFVRIYPNPSPGRVMLHVQDPFSRPIELNILGELGQSVYKVNNQSGDLQQELNLDHLANGFYILVVTTKDGRSVTKLIISH